MVHGYAFAISQMSSTPSPANPTTDPETRSDAQRDSTVHDGPMDVTPDQARQTHPWADIPEDVLSSSTEEILTRIRLIENDIKVCVSPYSASPPSQPNVGDAV